MKSVVKLQVVKLQTIKEKAQEICDLIKEKLQIDCSVFGYPHEQKDIIVPIDDVETVEKFLENQK